MQDEASRFAALSVLSVWGGASGATPPDQSLSSGSRGAGGVRRTDVI